MKNTFGKRIASTVMITCLGATVGYADLLTWSSPRVNTTFADASNWTPSQVPSSGNDDIIFNSTGNNEAFMSSSFTIGNTHFMRHTSSVEQGEDLKISGNGHLTLATGGTLDIGILGRANANSSNIRFTIEGGATADAYQFTAGEDYTTTFLANTGDVTTFNVSDLLNLDFSQPGFGADALVVDLTSYSLSNGNTLDLFTYGTLNGTFDTLNVTGIGGGTLSEGVDYTFNYGSGTADSISLTIIPEPSSLALLGMGAVVLWSARKRKVLA